MELSFLFKPIGVILESSVTVETFYPDGSRSRPTRVLDSHSGILCKTPPW